MPGSSLWLLPPPNHPLHPTLKVLIDKRVPSVFPSLSPPSFIPHVTLTSEIPLAKYTDSPAGFLESLQLPNAEDVCVRLTKLEFGQKFTQKVIILVAKEIGMQNPGLLKLARTAREKGTGARLDEAMEWVVNVWKPHTSLMYADLDISSEKEVEIERVVREEGVWLDDAGEMGGWTGGIVALVETEKPIGQWKPLAERPL